MTLISVACNDPDNGNFVGRFTTLHYGDDQDMEVECRYYGSRAGCSIRYLGDGRVRISRRIFRFKREKEWYGNWCWNALWMPRKEARRLLRYLRSKSDWTCVGGPTHLYNWFNRARLSESGEPLR